jgi:hypothetical protein
MTKLGDSIVLLFVLFFILFLVLFFGLGYIVVKKAIKKGLSEYFENADTDNQGRTKIK